MQCPYCSHDSRVLDSRAAGEAVRRRRECQDCKRRFTTYEEVAPLELKVVKRSGKTEDFERDKLLKVVENVTWDRPVTQKAREDLVRGLEAELFDRGAPSVASHDLADRLLARLRELDAMAANRYAANYTREDGSIRTRWDEPSPQLDLLAAPQPAAEQNPAEPPPARRRTRRQA